MPGGHHVRSEGWYDVGPSQARGTSFSVRIPHDTRGSLLPHSYVICWPLAAVRVDPLGVFRRQGADESSGEVVYLLVGRPVIASANVKCSRRDRARWMVISELLISGGAKALDVFAEEPPVRRRTVLPRVCFVPEVVSKVIHTIDEPPMMPRAAKSPAVLEAEHALPVEPAWERPEVT